MVADSLDFRHRQAGKKRSAAKSRGRNSEGLAEQSLDRHLPCGLGARGDYLRVEGVEFPVLSFRVRRRQRMRNGLNAHARLIEPDRFHHFPVLPEHPNLAPTRRS